MKTIKEYISIFKNEEEINKYFTSVEKAIKLFELHKEVNESRLKFALEAIEKNSVFNALTRSKIDTNRKDVYELYGKFQQDLVKILEISIKEEENKIEALKTFLR